MQNLSSSEQGKMVGKVATSWIVFILFCCASVAEARLWPWPEDFADVKGRRLGDRFITPDVSAGLLAGTFRQELLEQGEITTEEIPIEMLEHADEIFLINSLRKWRKAELTTDCQ